MLEGVGSGDEDTEVERYSVPEQVPKLDLRHRKAACESVKMKFL
jgi:hypothetical protein